MIIPFHYSLKYGVISTVLSDSESVMDQLHWIYVKKSIET